MPGGATCRVPGSGFAKPNRTNGAALGWLGWAWLGLAASRHLTSTSLTRTLVQPPSPPGTPPFPSPGKGREGAVTPLDVTRVAKPSLGCAWLAGLGLGWLACIASSQTGLRLAGWAEHGLACLRCFTSLQPLSHAAKSADFHRCGITCNVNGRYQIMVAWNSMVRGVSGSFGV